MARVRLEKLYCGHCGRSVPRAGVHCPWCSKPVRPFRAGSPPRPPGPPARESGMAPPAVSATGLRTGEQ